MSGPQLQYQVIAELPVDDFAVMERVEKGLSRAFKLDLSAQRTQLRRGGVCVCRVDTIPLAKVQAELVRGIGADYRILDAQGRVVGRGEGRRGGAEAPRIDSTLSGGFQAPGGTRRPTDVGLAATMIGTAPGAAPPLQEGALGRRMTPSGLDLLPTGDDTIEQPSFNMDGLQADDLVLLDGTRGEQPQPQPAPGSREQSPPMSVFAPPIEDETLELDEPAPSRTRPPVAPPPPQAVSAPTLVEDDAPALEDLRPEPSAPRPVSARAVTSTPPPGTLPEPEADRAQTPVPVRPPRTSAGTSAARRARGAEFVLFGGRLREHPRARIALGFLLALGLGSVGPIVQSRSVVTARIRPELQELSTVRAYPALARLASYRSPEDIEDAISGIKARSGVISFVIWLGVSGLLTFLWFRFV